MKPIESLFNDPKNHPLEDNWRVSGGADEVAGGPMTTLGEKDAMGGMFVSHSVSFIILSRCSMNSVLFLHLGLYVPGRPCVSPGERSRRRARLNQDNLPRSNILQLLRFA